MLGNGQSLSPFDAMSVLPQLAVAPEIVTGNLACECRNKSEHIDFHQHVKYHQIHSRR